ncbi:hypothetical protein F5Y18DRAFT_191545 [Xylariaceae sp. FL1019]|nr:hypothetical protein F5Y18DRAFT_191545 [Xylariaceae sp. FL1019]
MAAPPNKTIGNHGGKWVQNHALCDSIDPALQIQGIGWLIRKAVSVATVTLHIKQYNDSEGQPHIDIDQVATGGLKGTSEHRTLDFQFREHSDWLFGTAKGQSKFVTKEELDAIVAEQTKQGILQDDFLSKGFIDEDSEKTEDGKLLVYNHVVSNNGWFATQTWGFQVIGGERRYTRHICVSKEGKFANVQLIFDWAGEL